MTEENGIINNEEKEENVNEGRIVYGEDRDGPRVKWEPVAQIDEKKGLDPYEHAPQKVREFHENYCNMWLRDKKRR